MECLNTLTTRKLYLFFILRPIYGVGLSPSGLTDALGKTLVKEWAYSKCPQSGKFLRKVLQHRHFSGVILKIFRTALSVTPNINARIYFAEAATQRCS